ncbi:nucleoside triphosphate pyrophosphohydrolase family protein [Patescibacteria group bacterium]|nr:nucleoside triphosphate pyrophosphohydrolase family protein [Patescibacteria group bacterium]
MTFQEYQKLSRKSAIYPEKYNIIYPAIGLGDEAGEVLGKIKKWLRGDDETEELTKERKDAIEKEIGDVLWYLAQISTDVGINLEEAAESNIEKLYKRLEEGKIKGDGDNR